MLEFEEECNSARLEEEQDIVEREQPVLSLALSSAASTSFTMLTQSSERKSSTHSGDNIKNKSYTRQPIKAKKADPEIPCSSSTVQQQMELESKELNGSLDQNCIEGKHSKSDVDLQRELAPEQSGHRPTREKNIFGNMLKEEQNEQNKDSGWDVENISLNAMNPCFKDCQHNPTLKDHTECSLATGDKFRENIISVCFQKCEFKTLNAGFPSLQTERNQAVFGPKAEHHFKTDPPLKKMELVKTNSMKILNCVDQQKNKNIQEGEKQVSTSSSVVSVNPHLLNSKTGLEKEMVSQDVAGIIVTMSPCSNIQGDWPMSTDSKYLGQEPSYSKESHEHLNEGFGICQKKMSLESISSFGISGFSLKCKYKTGRLFKKEKVIAIGKNIQYLPEESENAPDPAVAPKYSHYDISFESVSEQLQDNMKPSQKSCLEMNLGCKDNTQNDATSFSKALLFANKSNTQGRAQRMNHSIYENVEKSTCNPARSPSEGETSSTALMLGQIQSEGAVLVGTHVNNNQLVDESPNGRSSNRCKEKGSLWEKKMKTKAVISKNTVSGSLEEISISIEGGVNNDITVKTPTGDKIVPVHQEASVAASNVIHANANNSLDSQSQSQTVDSVKNAFNYADFERSLSESKCKFQFDRQLNKSHIKVKPSLSIPWVSDKNTVEPLEDKFLLKSCKGSIVTTASNTSYFQDDSKTSEMQNAMSNEEKIEEALGYTANMEYLAYGDDQEQLMINSEHSDQDVLSERFNQNTLKETDDKSNLKVISDGPNKLQPHVRERCVDNGQHNDDKERVVNHNSHNYVKKPAKDCSFAARTRRIGLSQRSKAKKAMECNYCWRSFTHISSYIIHRRIHTGERPYNCQECGKHFAQRSNLNAHKKLHSFSEDMQCQFLSDNKKLIGQCQLNKPKQTVFGSGDLFGLKRDCNSSPVRVAVKERKTHFCNVCGKGFRFSSMLKIHMRVHSGEKPYSCKKCGKTFSQASSVRVHERIHWTVKPYVCNLCKKGFSQLGTLKAHLRRHKEKQTPKVEKMNFPITFQCHICKKSFGLRHQYNLHMRTHGDLMSCSCDHCEQKFTKISELSHHCQFCTQFSGKETSLTEVQKDLHVAQGLLTQSFLLHHPKLNQHQPEAGCDINHIKKTDQLNLLPHRFFLVCAENNFTYPHTAVFSQSHPAYGESDPRKYLCPRCGRLFRHLGRLRAHILSHAKRHYTCGLCCKTFENWNKFWLHQRIHKQKMGRFFCLECGQGFRFSWLYKKHFEEHVEKQTIEVSLCPSTFVKEIEQSNQKECLRSSKHVCRKDLYPNVNLTDHPHSSNKLCSFCNLTFSSVSVLEEHMKKIHGNSVFRSSIPLLTSHQPYQCGCCDATFKSLNLLYHHQLCHSSSSSKLSWHGDKIGQASGSVQPQMFTITTSTASYHPGVAQMSVIEKSSQVFCSFSDTIPIINTVPQLSKSRINQQSIFSNTVVVHHIPTSCVRPLKEHQTHTSQLHFPVMTSQQSSSPPKLQHIPPVLKDEQLQLLQKPYSTQEERISKCCLSRDGDNQGMRDGLLCAECGEQFADVTELYEHYLQHAKGEV